MNLVLWKIVDKKLLLFLSAYYALNEIIEKKTIK